MSKKTSKGTLLTNAERAHRRRAHELAGHSWDVRVFLATATGPWQETADEGFDRRRLRARPNLRAQAKSEGLV